MALASLKSAVKGVLARLRQRRRRRDLEKTVRHVTREEIAAGLRGLGIERGDVVFLHSSLKSLGFVVGGPRAVLDALIDVVGPEGTLIVPTYYLPGGTIFNTCTMPDYVFDPRTHGSNLGALPDTFVKMPGVERSIHPTHSVSAIGKHARYVTEAHHRAPSVFGAGSPWDRFVELDGKLLGLGITMGPVTFYHLLEDRMRERFPLPVRMSESYALRCLDWDGKPLTVPVVPLAPAYMERRIDHKSRDDLRDYFWREFSRAQLLTVGNVADARAWYIGGQAFYRHLEALMHEGITIYATADELARRPIASA
jgi:aminoglycoside N3'-acetyltransferase